MSLCCSPTLASLGFASHVDSVRVATASQPLRLLLLLPTDLLFFWLSWREARHNSQTKLTSSQLLASSVSEACQSFLASIDIIPVTYILYILFIVTTSFACYRCYRRTTHTFAPIIVIGLLTSKKRPVNFSRGHDDAAFFNCQRVFVFVCFYFPAPLQLYTVTDKRERKAWLACIPTYLVHTYLHTLLPSTTYLPTCLQWVHSDAPHRSYADRKVSLSKFCLEKVLEQKKRVRFFTVNAYVYILMGLRM